MLTLESARYCRSIFENIPKNERRMHTYKSETPSLTVGLPVMHENNMLGAQKAIKSMSFVLQDSGSTHRKDGEKQNVFLSKYVFI
jgi:hypothetical protein